MSPREPLHLTASADYSRTVTDLVELLGKLKIEHAFVGSVAEKCWLAGTLDSGPVDVLALLAPDRMGQLPMMASNRGFLVDKEEVESASELDLLPMKHPSAGGAVRVHILMATNALYARMVNAAVDASAGDVPLRVVSAEDLALLFLMQETPEATGRVRELVTAAGEAFDSQRFNEKLISIGLREKVLF